MEQEEEHEVPFPPPVEASGSGPNFWCFRCKQEVANGLQGFMRHLKRVDHIPPYICGQGNCRRDYVARTSLYNHLRTCHLTTPLPPLPPPTSPPPSPYQQPLSPDPVVPDHSVDSYGVEAVPGSPNVSECGVNNDPAVMPTVNLATSAEMLVLKLRSVNYMTSTAVQVAEEECFSLLSDGARQLKSCVEQFLQGPRTDQDVQNLLLNFNLSDPFEKLKTKAQQLETFREKYGLLQADEINLLPTIDSRLDPNAPQLRPTQVKQSFQYLKISTILKCVMSDPYMRHLICNEKPNDSMDFKSFRDGSLYASLPDSFKKAIRIVLYSDDLGLLQALSPRAERHIITGIYFTIQNLPAEVNSELKNIFVTALIYAQHAKQDDVWALISQDLRQLETDGLDFVVDGESVNMKAVLIAVIGDTLAAHMMLGFAPPSANCLCRVCYITRAEMHLDPLKLGLPRTPEQHLIDVGNSHNAAIRKQTGVAGPSKIDGLQFYSPVVNTVSDIFHDLHEGVCKMEVKLALREYVCKKKYFSVDTMKSRIQFFDYGLPDAKNKPQSSMTAAYLNKVKTYNLHQTGSQMWLLTRAFGFLFGDLVPPDDKFMTLISYLNQIMKIIFAQSINEQDLQDLDQLIADHHTVFKEIFPGCAAGTNSTDPEEPEEIVEDEIFNDLFEQEDDDLMVPTVQTPDTPAVDQPENDLGRQRRVREKIIRVINKHHYLLHSSQKIREFGPLNQYSCIRYEARHYFFKLAATVSHNFKNVLKTLMEMLQMKTAADNHFVKPLLKMGRRGTKLLSVGDSCYADLLMNAGFHAPDLIHQVQHVELKGNSYRPGLFLTLEPQSAACLPVFAIIKAVFVTRAEDDILLSCQQWRTECFVARYCAFHVSPEDTPPALVRISQFPYVRLLAQWKRYDSDKIYLSPRTIN